MAAFSSSSVLGHCPVTPAHIFAQNCPPVDNLICQLLLRSLNLFRDGSFKFMNLFEKRIDRKIAGKKMWCGKQPSRQLSIIALGPNELNSEQNGESGSLRVMLTGERSRRGASSGDGGL